MLRFPSFGNEVQVTTVDPAAMFHNGRWRFEGFEFDARSLELRKEGRAIRVRPQSLKVLRMLLERSGELITRAELHGGLWGGETFVDYDQGVNHCIKELRAALGDHADAPRFIETLSRRGYRFIAPVECPAPAADAGPPPSDVAGSSVQVDAVAMSAPPDAATASRRATRGWAAAALMAAAVAAIAAVPYLNRSTTARTPYSSSITVLPFTVHPDDAGLGAGLANAISRRLGGQQALAIRGSVPAERVGLDAVDAASSNPATLALHGEIVGSGHELSVTVRLAPLGGGADVWSERFKLRSDELFSVEDVVAEHVVSALGLRLAAAEQQRLRRRYTSNTAAYADYLRGRAALVRYTPATTLDAVAAFERALRRDPSYALARAGLAMACADMCLRFASANDVERWAQRADVEARAALELDPELAEAHLARAAVARKREFDWNTTVAASRRALLLNPNLDQARFFMAAAYYHLGYMEEALIEVRNGRALHGGDVVEPARIEALVALFSGHFAPALAHLEEVSRASSQSIGDTYLALAAYYSGSIERGRTMLESLSRHSSTTTAVRSTAVLAGILAAEGDAAAARDRLASVLAGDYRDHHVAYSVGVAYAQLAEIPKAMQWLRTAADTGFPCVLWFERDPLLAPARRDPAFAALLDHVRQRRETTLSTAY